ncbi:MAG: biopolymer transporter ExbD [Pseudomonadota bacterium]
MRRRATQKKRREPTIALINVVFLMLIFFLIAGTVAPPIANDIELVTLADLEGSQPQETLAIFPDGRVVWQGEDVDPAAFETGDGDVVRILPDRNLPAWRLMEIAQTLQAAGASELLVVTERALDQ